VRAAYVATPRPADPVAAAVVGEVDRPAVPDGWAEVEVRAAALNQHDLWLLRGAGVRPELLPLVLGSDAAGVVSGPGGREVVVHAVLPDPPGRLAPGATLLCDGGFGTLAPVTAAPADHLVDKPSWLSWQQAACLPTAWLTAWRMLVTQARVEPGQVVLVQGAGGGVAGAAAALAIAMGCEVHVTSRSAVRREHAVARGAAGAHEPGGRLPRLADVVVESVGPATWAHSLKALRPGGTLVVCGSATGFAAETDLARVFARQLRILGSSMGSVAELRDLVAFVDEHRVVPEVDTTVGLDEVPDALARLDRGDVLGKVCVVPR
jgi:NADPH:quinone reductase-like Zn-dependent oxidoreductase